MQPDPGSVVVARTKHVVQVGTVTLQVQDPSQVSAESVRHAQEEKSSTRTQDVHIYTLPRPLEEPGPHVQSPLRNIVKEAASESLPQTPTLKHPLLSKDVKDLESERGSPRSQPHRSRSEVKKSSVPQSSDKPPRPPVMVRSEVHSKAQSMARSRLEKARSRLQGRIQQAIKMFGGRDVSEPQVKRKQVSSSINLPAGVCEMPFTTEKYKKSSNINLSL